MRRSTTPTRRPGHRCSRPVTARISGWRASRSREGEAVRKMVVREATAVDDRTMITMFSRLEASVGRVHQLHARPAPPARYRAGRAGGRGRSAGHGDRPAGARAPTTESRHPEAGASRMTSAGRDLGNSTGYGRWHGRYQPRRGDAIRVGRSRKGRSARRGRHPARGGRGSPAQMLSRRGPCLPRTLTSTPNPLRTTTIQEAVDQAEPGDVVCVFSLVPRASA